jgi:unsaturated chondroitin disaccharide hydrolase
MNINSSITPENLVQKIEKMWSASAEKLDAIAGEYDRALGSPVFTVNGKYTTRGWTEWTQGFEYGSHILQFDATEDERFLESGKNAVVERMASHVTHFGVHDHGFNNVSTYGNLLRLMKEGRLEFDAWERNFYELALKCSGAVQARRWTSLGSDKGFIYSFNGPHSLFADTMRSLRALGLAHQLGHSLMGENDVSVSLFDRFVQHAKTTAAFAVYYGENRDAYDLRGRVAHESIFNTNDGAYRCPNSQQGYSGFTTWTRGLAWIMCGYAEQLEYLKVIDDAELVPHGGRQSVEDMMLRAAQASCDFYIDYTPRDGIPYWDSGAPGLAFMEDYLSKDADPYNKHEPVDSSAAAIAAQGLLRLGVYLTSSGDAVDGERYWQAGLSVVDTLLSEKYLSLDPSHHGLILHSVYHRPNGWDHVPEGQHIPCGESSMWGDYHAREVALYVQRIAKGEPELRYFI